MAADSMALEMEFRVFEQHKKEWLQAHPGEFVVVAATSVAGFYPDYESALTAISFPGTDLLSFDAIRVVACPIIRRPFFSCLIGRDILQKFRLTYDGRTGEVEIRA